MSRLYCQWSELYGPDPKIDTLFQTYKIHGFRLRKHLRNASNFPMLIAKIALSKSQTKFLAKVHKTYHISDQNGSKNHTLWRRTYLYSLYKGVLPPGIIVHDCRIL